MSYQVLARKWRPKTFREMAGQGHVLKALVNALDHDRLHHAYLFTGTRGVGKTTIARILAKCLNCEVGVSSEPCGVCDACTSIDQGRFVDLIEVDAASRTKVEDTRELLENVQYAPTRGRYKVYLIDEVHMLTGHSFNALLKTLEEPPPHVKFLLATTDPQKIPATILSRCLQFNLKNMSPERIVNHLKLILDKELVSYQEEALWLLSRAADGSMRDALSLTDQAIAFGSGKLQESDVREMLGSIDQAEVNRLMEALARADGQSLLAVVAELAEHGADFSGVLEALTVIMHRIAIAQIVPDGLDNSLGDRQQLIELAARFSAEDIQFYYQMALLARRDLSLSPDPRSGLEMALLRMLAFKPTGIAELPTTAVSESAPSGEPAATVKKPEAPQVAPAEAPPEVEDEPAIASAAAVEPPETPAEPAEPATETVQAEPVPMPAALSLRTLDAGNWCEQFDRLALPGLLGSMTSHCVLTQVEGNCLHLRLPEQNTALLSDTHVERLQQALSAVFAEPVTVKLTTGDVSGESPALYRQRRQAERLEQARRSLDQDPVVQTLLQVFDAQIEESSVEPVLAEQTNGRGMA